MKKYLCLLVACMAFAPMFGQTCAYPYTTDSLLGVTYNEVCDPTGAYTYALVINADTDSSLVFMGLWEVSQTQILADINCTLHSFVIPRQQIITGFDIEGGGYLNAPDVHVYYGIYETGSATLVDSCHGIYPSMISVGITSVVLAQVKLYPNPAQDRVNIMASGLAATEYKIVDLQGRVASQGLLDDRLSAEIDLKGLAQGLYRVVVQDADGQFASKVLVVE